MVYRQIADRLEIDRRTLTRWKQYPGFAARIDEHLAEIRDEVRRVGLADLYNRISALNERWEAMRRIIDERAADPEMANVPGGTTGLLVKTVRRVVVEDETRDGSGRRSSREICEYSVDTGLLREILAHEKQAAQELGQWMEKTEAKVSVGAIQPIRIVNVHCSEPRMLDQAEAGCIVDPENWTTG
jgi:hypothetical protein